MAGSIQNRLLHHEEVPPPAVWANIARQLDEEFVSADASVSMKLEDSYVTPPSQVWQNIYQQLESNDQPKAGKVIPVVPVFYKRLVAASLIAAALAAGAMYFFTGNDTSTQPVPTTEIVQQPAITPDAEPRNEDARAILTDSGDDEAKKVLIASANRPRKTNYRNTISEPSSTVYQFASLSNIEEAPAADLKTVPALQPVSVSAPLIRDARGNIILDVNLICKSDKSYVTITGPNGHQTRISNKFLNCLSYMNNSFNATDIDENGIECKSKFEEWRSKLLNDAAFIPAANNFFDIFEMKEMIQD